MVPGVVATHFSMKHVGVLPQNAKLIPQLLYDNIQISPYEDGKTLDPEERERLLFHIGYALEVTPEAPMTMEEA